MLGRATWVIEAAPEGRSVTDPRNILNFEYHVVNPGGLSNLGIKVTAGRDVDDHDTADRPLVAVISQSLADTWWAGQDPIGKRFYRPLNPAPITVVGVAADVRHRERFTLADAAIGIPPGSFGPQRDAYLAFAQRPNAALVVALRISGESAVAAQTLRQAVLSIDPALPVYNVAMLDERLADQERPSRVLSGLTTTYAVVALLLAAFGLFGVLAHAVRGLYAGNRHPYGSRGPAGGRDDDDHARRHVADDGGSRRRTSRRIASRSNDDGVALRRQSRRSRCVRRDCGRAAVRLGAGVLDTRAPVPCA